MGGEQPIHRGWGVAMSRETQGMDVIVVATAEDGWRCRIGKKDAEDEHDSK